jgi:[ribosomal protein S5]-alanine N-acetyltransferase
MLPKNAIKNAMELRSERLSYRKFTQADASEYLRLVTNGDVMQYITQRALTKEEGLERFANNLNTNAQHPDFGFFAVYRIEDSGNDATFVGLAKFVLSHEHQAEMGYSLLPEHWGKKYASEIVGRFVAYARTLHALHELIAFVETPNTASIRVLANQRFELDKQDDSSTPPLLHYKLQLPTISTS